MVTLDAVRRRNLIPSEVDNEEIDRCLRAAVSRLKGAGVPEFRDNALYDLTVIDLAGFFHYQKGLTADPDAEAAMRRMLNAAVLELRHAKEDWV